MRRKETKNEERKPNIVKNRESEEICRLKS